MGILASIVLVTLTSARTKAYNARVKLEVRSISQALDMYSSDHYGQYPCDVSRDLPSGLEQYLTTSSSWPKAPWPGSVYDWDYWSPDPGSTGGCAGNLVTDGNPNHDKPVYQISIRFCDIGGGNCHFPNESWAIGFDSQSSVYWCLEGPCRAHGSEAYNLLVVVWEALVRPISHLADFRC